VAAAIELAQLATLVVDDVIDRSEVRSGWSAYKIFGEGVSLLAGEMLKSCASALFARALERKTRFVNPLRALRQFEIMYERINVGQLLDLLYESSPGISEREYLRMIRLSTGGFLEGSAAVGSTLSGAPDHLQKLLRNYACCLGIALQIYDDVLDLFPQPGRTKPFANDLKRRKQRLPLIHFLHTCSPRERGKVDRILGKGGITDKDAEIVARLLVQQGSAQYALRRAKEFCSRALFSAARITPASVRHLLVGLVHFIQPEDASWLETGP
jgi:geranylgeranyl diphosphate synthase type I